MGLETILKQDGFELAWENSADFLHLLFRHQELALGFCLNAQERRDFLEIVREAQRSLAPPPEHRRRLGSLPAQSARLRVALGPGARLVLEAVRAGRQLFEVELEARSSLRALIHVLTQDPAERSVVVRGYPQEAEDGRLRVGGHTGVWDPQFSHVVGPCGEWLPRAELTSSQEVTAWLNSQEVWERLSLAVSAPPGLVDRGLYFQAETAPPGGSNPAELALAQAYLVVHRGPLLEALPHLEEARAQAALLSEPDENLLLELETYLLCQQGPEQLRQIAQNMQKLVARQLTRDRWAGRRALSNWRVFLDLLYGPEVPPMPLQVWQGWLAQLGSPLEEFTLSFARPQGQRPPQRAAAPPARAELPPERSLAAPLIAIVLALILGFWWRYKHPVDWGPPAVVTATP